MAAGNFHIGIMGNLFSGKTTLMNALAGEPYRTELEALLDGAETHAFSERVEKGSLTDECLALFYRTAWRTSSRRRPRSSTCACCSSGRSGT